MPATKAPTNKTSAKKPAPSRKAPIAKSKAPPPGKSASEKPKPPAVTAKKPKLVRDSFTLPEDDHALIKECKKLAVASGRETKKSEVVRAAIRRFAALSKEEQLNSYKALSPISVGRPKKR